MNVRGFSIPPWRQIGGVDSDIAKESCLEIVPVSVDPAATIQHVVPGKADIAVGDWYRT